MSFHLLLQVASVVVLELCNYTFGEVGYETQTPRTTSTARPTQGEATRYNQQNVSQTVYVTKPPKPWNQNHKPQQTLKPKTYSGGEHGFKGNVTMCVAMPLGVMCWFIALLLTDKLVCQMMTRPALLKTSLRAQGGDYYEVESSLHCAGGAVKSQ